MSHKVDEQVESGDGPTTGAPETEINTQEKMTVTVKGRNVHGHDAPLGGPATFTFSDPTVASIMMTADGRSATITGIKPGTTSISVAAPATSGGGTVTAEGKIVVTEADPSNEAVGMTIHFGRPQPK